MLCSHSHGVASLNGLLQNVSPYKASGSSDLEDHLCQNMLCKRGYDKLTRMRGRAELMAT